MSTTEIDTFSERNFHFEILVDVLDKYADTGKEFDVFPFIKRCALDIICGMT